MQPTRLRQPDLLLVEINNTKVHESSRDFGGGGGRGGGVGSAGSFPEQRQVIEPNLYKPKSRVSFWEEYIHFE